MKHIETNQRRIDALTARCLAVPPYRKSRRRPDGSTHARLLRRCAHADQLLADARRHVEHASLALHFLKHNRRWSASSANTKVPDSPTKYSIVHETITGKGCK